MPNPIRKAPLITREYNGQAFLFRQDGYFNMTKAAQAFDKQLVNFWSNQETDAYLVALARSLKLIHWDSNDWSQSDVRDAYDALVIRHRGGRTPGTWAHPKLAVFFARWLSIEFSVVCDAVIEDILKRSWQRLHIPAQAA